MRYFVKDNETGVLIAECDTFHIAEDQAKKARREGKRVVIKDEHGKTVGLSRRI